MQGKLFEKVEDTLLELKEGQKLLSSLLSGVFTPLTHETRKKSRGQENGGSSIRRCDYKYSYIVLVYRTRNSYPYVSSTQMRSQKSCTKIVLPYISSPSILISRDFHVRVDLNPSCLCILFSLPANMNI